MPTPKVALEKFDLFSHLSRRMSTCRWTAILQVNFRGANTTYKEGQPARLLDHLVARSLIAGGLSTPFRDASAGVMVLSAVVHLDWLDGAA